MSRLLPILTVLGAILVLWYGASVWLNSQWTYDQAARAGAEPTFVDVIEDTMMQERPVLPAPHQVAEGLWQGLAEQKITSKRSLVWHGWITLQATFMGFGIGAGFGVILAIYMVHSRAADLSVMPWAIASQTIPVVALAPMIVVVLGQMGAPELVPRAVLAGYLSFFPVAVGMTKGLRAPDPSQLDLMRTYHARPAQVLVKLRLPASMPYLFASLKVGIAASFVGAIVAEVSAAKTGLGARLLSGSYYGQTVMIWATLVVAACLAAALIFVMAAIERGVLRRMGMVR